MQVFELKGAANETNNLREQVNVLTASNTALKTEVTSRMDLHKVCLANYPSKFQVYELETKSRAASSESDSLRDHVIRLKRELLNTNNLVSAEQEQQFMESSELLGNLRREWEAEKQLLTNEISSLKQQARQQESHEGVLTMKLMATQSELGTTNAELKSARNGLLEERSRAAEAASVSEAAVSRMSSRCGVLEAAAVRKSAINTVLCKENGKLVAANADLCRQVDRLKEFESSYNNIVKQVRDQYWILA